MGEETAVARGGWVGHCLWRRESEYPVPGQKPGWKTRGLLVLIWWQSPGWRRRRATPGSLVAPISPASGSSVS